MKSKNLIIKVLVYELSNLITQDQILKDRKLKLIKNSSKYIKFEIFSQIWLKNQNLNPRSTVLKCVKNNSSNIGIKRYQIQFMDQRTDRVFIHSQICENNINGDRKFVFFVYEDLGEYKLVKNKINLSGGLTAGSRLLRFTAPSDSGVLGVNAPLYQQLTNDLTYKFVRKSFVYAKEKLGKLDYRIVISDPMAFQKSSAYSCILKPISNFSSIPPTKQLNKYFQYQLKDQESNLTPYMTGTYLGKKKVFYVGAGLVYQKTAIWYIAENIKDAVSTNMLQLAADVFYDAPIGKDGKAISIYRNATHFDFGPNYTRNLAVMNPANGTTNTNLLHGSGDGFTAYGTGNLLYTQIGIKSKDYLIGKASILPYASVQHTVYERLKTPMNFFNLGINILLAGHTSKLTEVYQNRPLDNIDRVQTDRRGAGIIQYQTFFN